jgi:branched-chain amino acid transport system ATP-binding protein
MTVAAAPLLEVSNLEVVYNRTVRAVQGVSLAVAEESVVAIVGGNGAGKSTTLAAIAGHLTDDIVQTTNGHVLLEGRECTRAQPHVMSRRGVALVPERSKIFSRLTTLENLLASGSGSRGDLVAVFDLFPRLEVVLGRTAGYLSGGERQMLAIAMGLRNRPKVLLVDEFSLGLAPVLVEELIEAIRRIRTELKMAVLLVEQSAAVAVQLADYVYVMENGRIVFEGESGTIVENDDFREFYLGVSSDNVARSYRDVKQYEKKKRWFG